jgi:WYL_2, Sm-like SH3 beta-barrel fold
MHKMYENLDEFGYSKEQFLLDLREGVVMVRFIKKDDSIRDMVCTLNFGKIPDDKHPKGTDKRTVHDPDNVPVFDVEKGEWRSVGISSIVYAVKQV